MQAFSPFNFKKLNLITTVISLKYLLSLPDFLIYFSVFSEVYLRGSCY